MLPQQTIYPVWKPVCHQDLHSEIAELFRKQPQGVSAVADGVLFVSGNVSEAAVAGHIEHRIEAEAAVAAALKADVL